MSYLDDIKAKAEEALRDDERELRAGLSERAQEGIDLERQDREPALARAVLKLARVAEAARRMIVMGEGSIHGRAVDLMDRGSVDALCAAIASIEAVPAEETT